MDFFDNFNWAVPKAFGDALAACYFEAGDVLYSDKSAYETWEDGKSPSKYSLQVTFPARSSGRKVLENQNSIFIRNWESAVELILLNDGRKIQTTQGHLYSFLHTGNFEELTASEKPPLPIFLDVLKKKISNKAITRKISGIINESTPNKTAAIMAYDETDGVAVDKSKAIMEALDGIPTTVMDLPLGDFPLLTGKGFLPTPVIRVFLLPSNQIKECRNRLIEALWPRRDARSATKSFCDVVNRMRSVSSNSFKLSIHLHILDTIENNAAGADNSRVPKSLQNFLSRVRADFPAHLFKEDGLDVSGSALNVSVDFKKSEKPSLDKFNSSHEDFIAAEVPLWMESEELKDYLEIFGTRETFNGAIDVLCMEDDEKIGIWLKRPETSNPSALSLQLFMLAFTLSIRTGLKLSSFICGYYTDKEIFHFDPCLARVSPCHKESNHSENQTGTLF